MAAPLRALTVSLCCALPTVTLGGSLTFGRGASSMGQTDWVPLLRGWLQAAFPGVDHVVHNGAVAASPSEYMALCMQARAQTVAWACGSKVAGPCSGSWERVVPPADVQHCWCHSCCCAVPLPCPSADPPAGWPSA